MTNDSKTAADEAAQKAAEARARRDFGILGFRNAPERDTRERYQDDARAMLEAAAPTLRRQLAEEIAQAIRDIPIGPGSEHWKHGRETMRADAVKAIEEITRGSEWGGGR